MKNRSSESNGGRETDDLEIIDAHSHLGDILYEDGGSLIDQQGVPPNSAVCDTAKILALLKYKFGEKLKEPNKLFRALGTYAGRQRNFGATLENMQASLKCSDVSRACCLPIPPNVSFDDLKKAQKSDSRVIPFTGVDFNHFEGFEAKLKRDVEQGAKGMKIHPIIQNISPEDRRMHQVLEAFEKYDLPILFHTGRVTYYFGEDRKKENPDFGKIELLEKLISSSKSKVNIVLGHAGMFEFDYVTERMARYTNVFVDTTFQHPERIQKLINAFGSERVLFGSDWPYADRQPSVHCVRLALKQAADRQIQTKIFRDNIKHLIHL
jgi:uncharacterized protein